MAFQFDAFVNATRKPWRDQQIIPRTNVFRVFIYLSNAYGRKHSINNYRWYSNADKARIECDVTLSTSNCYSRACRAQNCEKNCMSVIIKCSSSYLRIKLTPPALDEVDGTNGANNNRDEEIKCERSRQIYISE